MNSSPDLPEWHQEECDSHVNPFVTTISVNIAQNVQHKPNFCGINMYLGFNCTCKTRASATKRVASITLGNNCDPFSID